MKRIASALGVLAVLSLGAFVLFSQTATAPHASYGATNTQQLIGGFPYFLAGSGISSSATSLTLTSLTLPQTGYKILTTDLSNPFYVTFESGNTTRQEFASCTTVVQNANNTATLSGCTRGLLPLAPYTASSTYAFSHSGGTTVIFSNPPQVYNQFYALGNAATSTNTLVFSSTSPPRYDGVGAQGSGTYIATTSELASIAYVNAVTTAGAANATAFVKGLVQLATGLQAASSTALGSTGASLVIPASVATDTPGVGTSASRVVVSDLLGNVWKTVIGNLNVANLWTAAQTFSGGLISTGTATSTGSAFGFTSAYGDGSDSASTTAASYTLTRDYYFTNYTVSSGNTINTGNYRIFVSGTFTDNGTISNNGNNGGGGSAASGGTGGAAGAAATATSAGSLTANIAGTIGGVGGNGNNGGGGGGGGGGGASGGLIAIYAKNIVIGASGIIQANGGNGGNGGNGASALTTSAACGSAGGNGTGITLASSIGVTSATGAIGGSAGVVTNCSGNGSSAGTVSFATALTTPHNVVFALNMFDAAPSITAYKTSAGGIGGGGGGGGGYNSANSGSGCGGGGGTGGGGSGGVLVLVYSSLVNSGTLSVAAGTAGATAGLAGTGTCVVAGTAGSVASNGLTGVIYKVQI